jgi:hypothetical protein
MHRGMCVLSATLLAAHMLWGCCWHHAHTCYHEHAGALQGEAADHAVLMVEGGVWHVPATVPDERHEGDACQGGACVFKRPNGVRVPSTPLASHPAPRPSDTAQSGGAAPWGLTLRRVGTPPPTPSEPLYLVYGVLLI